MKQLKELRRQNLLFRRLTVPIAWIYKVWYWYIVPDRLAIRNKYKNAFGTYPDLDNPRTLNEKIQWLKLFDRTELHTICADKYAVRNYIKTTIGAKYLVPLLYTTTDPEDISLKNLPNQPLIIKTNHDSSGGIVIQDKGAIDFGNVREQLKKRLKKNYYFQSREWQYKHIAPRIIVEKLLTSKSGKLPLDYKFHCFNGSVEFIGVDIDRFDNHRRNFYDREWQLHSFVWSAKDYNNKPLWPNGPVVRRPQNLDEMTKVAQELARPFKYCRVDLYSVDEKIYFGEITFHHGGGTEAFFPEKLDMELGAKLDLHSDHQR